MKYDIRTIIDNCEACQQLRPGKPFEPLATAAKFPMEQLSVYFMHVNGKNFMVTADRYTGYIWVEMLRSLNAKAVTDVLDKITRMFGVPLTCRTDGGPQFWGPFDKYCRRKGIVHETSSPYNPRSNDHAEAAVKAAKHLILKTRPYDFPSALAAWRNTARETKPSPKELMFCRKVRDARLSSITSSTSNCQKIVDTLIAFQRSEKMQVQVNSKTQFPKPELQKLPQDRPSKTRLISTFWRHFNRATEFVCKIHAQNAGT